MKSIRITVRKGLNIPISGTPEQRIVDTTLPSHVALLGSDYHGLKPHFTISVGDSVKLGQTLFIDKKKPSIQFVAPGSGKVTAINRGEKRSLLSIVIKLENSDEITFRAYNEEELPALDRKYVTSLLLESGLWTAIRSRPFSRVADPDTIPHSIFITAVDTNPLAPSVAKIIEGNETAFVNGITVLSRLSEGIIYLCKAPGDVIPHPDVKKLSVAEFSGPHPSGNVGTHIHFLDPVGRNRQVWHIQAQDVISIGSLFTSGRLNVERVISLAGPSVRNPRLIRSRIGASVADITGGELHEGRNRLLSGSVLSGHTAREETAFLGRYHQQITVLPEGGARDFLGWLGPGLHQYSLKNIVLSRFLSRKKYWFNTSTHGDKRAIVPVGSYEKVMPLDIMPTYLLRSLAADDLDEAEKLGCLELDEEDLALCTFVCPSKVDHGAELRRNLMLIEKEW